MPPSTQLRHRSPRNLHPSKNITTSQPGTIGWPMESTSKQTHTPEKGVATWLPIHRPQKGQLLETWEEDRPSQFLERDYKNQGFIIRDHQKFTGTSGTCILKKGTWFSRNLGIVPTYQTPPIQGHFQSMWCPAGMASLSQWQDHMFLFMAIAIFWAG